MHLQESGQMYLETIYILTEENPNVRSIDVCEHMGFSKPSVSRAVGLLKQDGYLETDADGFLVLTELGKHTAQNIYERHTLLSTVLMELGVDPQTAAEDACRIEHHLSAESFNAIESQIRK